MMPTCQSDEIILKGIHLQQAYLNQPSWLIKGVSLMWMPFPVIGIIQSWFGIENPVGLGMLEWS